MAFEIIPQKFTYGGEALGYHEGRPVFVPLVLPGERVEVEAMRVAKGVVHARPLRVLEPSSERIAPPCPYFGRCGGCHYQHLSAERQANVKGEILRETLRRIGKIPWDHPIPVHAAHPWNYRNQAQFKLGQLSDGRLQIGFYEANSHRVFPVDQCLILSPRLNQILSELRSERWATPLATASEIELLADERDAHVAMVLRGDWPVGQAGIVAHEILNAIAGVASVATEADGRLRVFGQPHLTYAVGEFRYQVSPGSFFQVSRLLLPDLVAAVTFADPGKLALDLFAGVGLFSLPLARRFERVLGVESAASAAADLAANIGAHSLTNLCAVTAMAQDFLRRSAQTGIDLVVLDPPRAGVGTATLKLLADLRPRHIHYVSCSPPTLARDLGFLVTRGYRLTSVELFDFFPQTYHVETLARLALQDA
jgi:23S rRNA (uracil1939-C5)-methyltransferase